MVVAVVTTFTLPSSVPFSTFFPASLRFKSIAIPNKTPQIITRTRSSLSSPRPLTRRTNHLRPKLLRTLITKPYRPIPEETPQPLLEEEETPQDLQVALLSSHGFPLDAHLFVLEEEQEEVASEPEVRQMVGHDPLPAADERRGVPRLLLDISMYLVGLLAVQTVCAVWLFGGGNLGEGSSLIAPNTKTDGARLGDGNGVSGEVGEDELEFGRTVSKIQAMAREARATEAREIAERDGVPELRDDVMEEVNQRLDRLKKNKSQVLLDGKGVSNFRKRVGLRSSSAMSEDPPKGFNGSKNYAAPTKKDLGSGVVWQIGHDGHFKEFPELRDRRRSSVHGSDMTEKPSSSKDQPVSPLRDYPDVGGIKLSSQGTTERSESCGSISISGAKTRETETPIFQSSIEKGCDSSSISGNSFANSEIGLNKKIAAQHKSLLKKANDSQLDMENKFWWLKLPYVLAIFVRRGSDHKGLRGLYSLDMDSHSDGESSSSYTIVFQHRGDAKNFCYLLESVFENMDEFGADIVPLSIQEVHEAVKSRAWKVIVVRKGQLKLYAGQPLAEVDSALRSMLD